MNKKIVAKWKQKIDNENYLVRENLASYLGRKKNIKDAERVLICLLNDKESIVRSQAIKSLTKIGKKNNFLKILPLLNDKDEIVRIDAIESVAFLAKRKALKYIVKSLNDSSELVRRYAGGWIGEIGRGKYDKDLFNSLKSEHSNYAKVGLLEGLYLSGYKEKLIELINLLKSRRYIVRCVVASTLTTFANKYNKQLIQESLENALKNETTIAARSSIGKALKIITKKHRRKDR